MGIEQWIGFDIAVEAVAHCRQRFPTGMFAVDDLSATGWRNSRIASTTFDLVSAIDVLYHLVDDARFEIALKKLAALVNDGGLLLVSDVFVNEDRLIAPHVKRRCLATYQRILGPQMVMVDREPIFAILGDPVPRPGRTVDRLLLNAWRLLAKGVLLTPASLRDAVGAASVLLGWPVDALVRAAGLGRGVNLEAALFRKRAARWKPAEHGLRPDE